MLEHTYATLKESVMAMLLIDGPLTTGQIMAKLKVWKRERMLGCGFFPEWLPGVLKELQEANKIECAVGTWRTR